MSLYVNASSIATQGTQADEEKTFLDLPNEIIEKVFSNLDLADRSRLRVNRRLAGIEGTMKNREGGERWQMLTIYEGRSSELILWIADDALPKTTSIMHIEEFDRLSKNVEIGSLTITMDFLNKDHLALIPKLPSASIKKLVICQIKQTMFKCDNLNFENLRGLIQSTAKVHLKNVCASLSAEDVGNLREISKSVKSRSVEFFIEKETALDYADQYFGLHSSSFDLNKQEDSVRRTNGSRIRIYRYCTMRWNSDSLNRYVREDNCFLTILSKATPCYYRIEFQWIDHSNPWHHVLIRMQALSILLLSSLAPLTQAGHQTVGARGTFLCGDKPLVDAEVSLWDRDSWLNPDDRLSTVKTDKNGHFEIFGTDDEWLSIEPVLKIYHRCNNKGWFNLPGICKRKNSFEIPTSYINKGQQVGRWYEMGTMNMEAKQKGEDSKCT